MLVGSGSKATMFLFAFCMLLYFTFDCGPYVPYVLCVPYMPLLLRAHSPRRQVGWRDANHWDHSSHKNSHLYWQSNWIPESTKLSNFNIYIERLHEKSTINGIIYKRRGLYVQTQEYQDFVNLPAFKLASLAFALSARSTPTNILEAFHSWTKLMMFFMKQTGKLIIAIAWGYVTLARAGKVWYEPRPIGVWTHAIR